jgi:hypothetical protein
LPMAAMWSASAQNPKGIVVCLASCAKSDKGCQDQCVPSQEVRAEARACIAACRQSASDPDLVVEMTGCVAACLGRNKTQ